ncbi:hypothetical protein SAMN05444172_8352 [Burkholderia sp. GAS332]|nr:hypothetical protein SAMN05444172_8352 [Burkholderia sp. GAS332]
MNKKILGAALGLAVLAASTAASAHVDVAVGLGIPAAVYAPAEPVYAQPPAVVYAPAPVAVAYGGDDDWRARERREREWRRQEWRQHQWREHRDWRGY